MKNLEFKIDPEYTRSVSRTCKCGHVVNIYNKSGKVLCKWCGNIVFLNKKAEYDFKIKRRFVNATTTKIMG